jgi:hypothetical protein
MNMPTGLELVIKGSVMRTLQTLSVASLTTALLISTVIAESAPRKITVLKEVLLVPGNAAAAHAIVRTPDGGFIVAGSILIDTSENKVWATRVTSSGEVVWNYGMPTEADKDFRGIKGTLFGALMLPDNSALLCGSTGPQKPGDDVTGYLVRVDASGKVLSELTLHPNGDAHFGYSLLTRCLPWADGFALVGGLTHNQQSQGWLIKLNSQGMQEWEKVSSDAGGFDAIETADHDLITLDQGTGIYSATVRRLNSNGELIAKRNIERQGITLMRSIDASINAYCATYKLGSLNVTISTLDKDLHDASPERVIDTAVFDHGRGFIYPDKALAIFGYAQRGGATIAYVGSNSKQQVDYVFPRREGTVRVDDAVVLQSPTEFATVRKLIVSQEKRGIVLSWVLIK